VPEAVAKLTEGKSAASFCCQVAAWSPDMFGNFYLVKNHKIAKTQQPLKLEKKEALFWNPQNFRNFHSYYLQSELDYAIVYADKPFKLESNFSK
jgi:hypothetical protein